MPCQELLCAAAAAAYIEAHLADPLSLAAVAREARYSPYHLHRLFTAAAGIPLYGYIRRRRLTEAARQLTATRRPILDIALSAGYQSQQSFTAALAAMYKLTPRELRRRGRFYPLQLPLRLKADPSPGGGSFRLRPAEEGDIPAWISLLSQVAGGFPCLEEPLHRRQLARAAARGEALLLWDGDTPVGAAAFSRRRGSIDFLAAHPQYRRRGVLEALLEQIAGRELPERALSITTFRRGDPADPGQRAEYLALGFVEDAPAVQFGYPVQRLVLPPRREVPRHGG